MDTKTAGKMGGRKMFELRGKEWMKRISQLGVEAKKRKKDAQKEEK